MAKRRKKVPEGESKRDKFKRIVEPRVKKALKSIQLIGNCSGSAYEYTPDDIALISTALERAMEQLRKQYVSKGAAAIDFNLD